MTISIQQSSYTVVESNVSMTAVVRVCVGITGSGRLGRDVEVTLFTSTEPTGNNMRAHGMYNPYIPYMCFIVTFRYCNPC